MLFPAAKVIIRHPSKHNVILLLKRTINTEIFYEPPGGRVDYCPTQKTVERLEECAVREIKEELSVDVQLGHYIGSYYFFWTIDPKKCCVCAVFVGTIKNNAPVYAQTHADACNSACEAVWVDINDIARDIVPINKCLVGLKDIILHCNN